MNLRKNSAAPIWLVFLAVLGFLLLCGGALSTFQHTLTLYEHRKWVLTTHELVALLTAVEANVYRAESGARGYLLTGNVSDRQAYDEALQATRPLVERLKQAVKDEPTQEERLNEMRARLGTIYTDLVRAIALNEQGKKDEAVQLAESARTRSDMRMLTVILKVMREREDQMLSARTSTLNRLAQESLVRSSVFGIAAVLVLLFVFAFMRRVELKRRKAEQELSEARSLLDLILRSMGAGVVVSDRNGKFLFFNEAARRMLGLGAVDQPVEEWSKTYGVFLPDGTTLCPSDQLPLVRAFSGEDVDGSVLLIRNPQIEEPIWLSVNGRPLRHSDGTISGGVVVMEDISARIQAEKRVSEFYSTMSHELRTPLTSIRGALGLLEGGKGGELSNRAQNLVKMGREECDRLVRLINDILDIRKIEAGKLELKLEEVSASEIAEKTVETISAAAAAAKVAVEFHATANDSFVGDSDRIQQILTNLLSNAIKYSPAGASVMVAISTSDDAIKFSVKDQGPGIKKHDQEKLFKVFQQLDSSDSRAKGGTGLGLAICKALVEKHHGSIGLESQEGKGATFWFEVPKKQDSGNI